MSSKELREFITNWDRRPKELVTLDNLYNYRSDRQIEISNLISSLISRIEITAGHLSYKNSIYVIEQKLCLEVEGRFLFKISILDGDQIDIRWETNSDLEDEFYVGHLVRVIESCGPARYRIRE